MMSEERRDAHFVLFGCLEGNMDANDFFRLSFFKQRQKGPGGQKDWLELLVLSLRLATHWLRHMLAHFSVIWMLRCVWRGRGLGWEVKGGRGGQAGTGWESLSLG